MPGVGWCLGLVVRIPRAENAECGNSDADSSFCAGPDFDCHPDAGRCDPAPIIPDW